MSDTWSNLTDKTVGDTIAAADINTLMENIRFIGGNSTSEPNSNIETLNTNINSPASSTKTGDYTVLDDDGLKVIYLSGASADSTFTLPTLADNLDREITLYNLDTTYVLTIDGEGAETISQDGLATIELPKPGNYIKIKGGASYWVVIDEAITCQLRLDEYDGYGTTDNKIMTFANSRLDIGNMFTHNHGSYGTNGLEITILRSGKYAFIFTGMSNAGASAYGLSLNSTELTTNIMTITKANALNFGRDSGTYYTNVPFSGYFSKNDIIRPHCEGDVPSTAADNFFNVVYLGQ
jgi:hypothetical protein